MMMPNRTYSAESGYRYGFNGKENDNEVKGEGKMQDYGMRIYDPRLGKFLSVDPLAKAFPWYTPYQFAGNKPIWAIDLDGAEEKPTTPAPAGTANGTQTQTSKVINPPSDSPMFDQPETVRKTWYWYSGNLNRAAKADWYSKDQYDEITQDWEHGQVMQPRNFVWLGGGGTEYNGSWSSGRNWNGWQVDEKGYLTGHWFIPILGGAGGLEYLSGPGELKAGTAGIRAIVAGAELAKEGKSTYVVYSWYKKMESGEYLLYIGKAKTSVEARYGVRVVQENNIAALEKLTKIPDNATALGIEQHIMELNGWVGKAENATKPVLANKINATFKDIYRQMGEQWLNANVPNWKIDYKFQ
jgi:RHS repeat-associated protein